MRGEVIVHLTLSLRPSETRTADEIGTEILELLAGKPYAELDDTRDIHIADTALTNIAVEEI